MAGERPYVCVEIRLDALATNGTGCSGPLVDFTRLPYWNRVDGSHAARIVNAHTPFLGSSLTGESVKDSGYVLPAGLHLHWSLPDILTRSLPVANDGSGLAGVRMPAAPNRWLVTRKTATATKRWLVESDYLGADGAPGTAQSTAFPLFEPGRPDVTSQMLTKSGDAPWRRLGRITELTDSFFNAPFQPASDEHLAPGKALTALGWGHPAFAAHYPSCINVFGMCDTDWDSVRTTGATYQIHGWYSDPTLDLFCRDAPLFTSFIASNLSLGRAFGWKIDTADGWNPEAGSNADLPVASVFSGALTVPALADTVQPSQSIFVTGIGLGTNATEAIAAWQSRAAPDKTLTPDDLEDWLHSIQDYDALARHPLDLAFRMRELRVQRSMRPMPAGTEWALRQSETVVSANGEAGPIATRQQRRTVEQLLDDASIADALEDLNIAQESVDQLTDELESLQRRLHTDWCHFQAASHGLVSDATPYPDSELIWSHLTTLLLPGLAAHRKTLAEVTERRDALRADLIKRIGAEFELFSVPGDPYWQPRDPVLAIAATRFEANPRHKTANLCKRVMVPDGDLTSPAKLFARFENTFPAQTWQCPSHPVEIEWEVATNLLNLDESDQSAPTTLPPHALVSRFAPPGEPHKSAEAAIRSENVALNNCRAISVRGRSLCLPGTMHAFRYRIASWIVRHADVASLPTIQAFHDILGGFTKEQIIGSEVLAAVQFHITERGDLQSALVEWVAAQGWTLLPKQPARAFSSPPLPSVSADDNRLAENFTRALAQLAAISPDDADEEALNIQTISLDGLNDACGGFDRRYQLPVADPLIASDRLARVVEIAAEIDRFGGMEPCHSFGYAPLRTGYLTPGRLMIGPH